MPPNRTRRTAGAVASLVTAVALLTGCAADEVGDTAVAENTVIAPGRPGEPAVTYAPGDEVPLATPATATAADVAFVAGMIPHHEQALLMADLAPSRASEPRVKGLAARISDVQGAEIAVFEAWLAERGLGADGRPSGRRGADHQEHAGDTDPAGAMHGMASDAEIARLRSSTGKEFDRLWLELMTRHHQGALRMAADRDAGGGADLRVGEIAAGVVAEQGVEINRMATVRDELG